MIQQYTRNQKTQKAQNNDQKSEMKSVRMTFGTKMATKKQKYMGAREKNTYCHLVILSIGFLDSILRRLSWFSKWKVSSTSLLWDLVSSTSLLLDLVSWSSLLLDLVSSRSPLLTSVEPFLGSREMFDALGYIGSQDFGVRCIRENKKD